MPRVSWLHLSDLHAFQPDYEWDAGRVLEALREDLERIDARPDLLFFTGDAAFGLMKTLPPISGQFDEAFRVLDGICSHFKIAPERCFCVPGNHDVDREQIEADNQYWLENLSDWRELKEVLAGKTQDRQQLRARVLKRLDAYREFLRRKGLIHCGADNPALIYSKTISVNGTKLGIAGFNTALSCSSKDTERWLWMAAEWQLGTLRPHLAQADLRIALMHHPDNWLRESEGRFFQVCEQEFDFVLHGHEHQDWVYPLQPGNGGPMNHVRVAAGPLYESSKSENGYSITEWDSDTRRATILLREYLPKFRRYRSREIPGVTDSAGRWPASRQTSTGASAPLSTQTGYHIRSISSGTVIDTGGDCQRVVELNQVTIRDPAAVGTELNFVPISETTGYIDRNFVSAAAPSFGGFRCDYDPQHPLRLALDFGRQFWKEDRFNIEYSWWSLNGFALDERQFEKQYNSTTLEELAHFPLVHHADELNLYVLFPPSVASPAHFDMRPGMSVQVHEIEQNGRIKPNSRQGRMEQELGPRLQFMRRLGLASLHVPNPQPGYSYGIAWRVGKMQPASPGTRSGVNRVLLGLVEQRLLQHMESVLAGTLPQPVGDFFLASATLFRKSLMSTRPEWNGAVELTLMIFDERNRADRRLRIVAGCSAYPNAADPSLLELGPLPFQVTDSLPYGVGVAGKAYKTNKPHLWRQEPPGDRSIPDPYVSFTNGYQHAVLVSNPLQNPGDSRYVFGVVNCGSDDPKCPLAPYNGVRWPGSDERSPGCDQ